MIDDVKQTFFTVKEMALIEIVTSFMTCYKNREPIFPKEIVWKKRDICKNNSFGNFNSHVQGWIQEFFVGGHLKKLEKMMATAIGRAKN